LLWIMLANPNKFFQIGVLRQSLNCSEKTVRNDFNRIEEFLKPYAEATLIRKRGIGFSLETTEDIRSFIFQKMYRIPLKTKEERMIEIAYHLLISSKPVTLKDLAEKYFTNSADIKRDLDRIGNWLNRFNLNITTRQ